MSRTNAGRDWQAHIMGNPASNATGTYAPATYIGLTADVAAPNVASTVLTNELVGGTMARAQGNYGHTTGTASYTLTKLFNADRPVTVAKIGIFNASAAGILAFETALDSPATLKSGDTLQIVFTGSL